jgi:hypothetical protein
VCVCVCVCLCFVGMLTYSYTDVIQFYPFMPPPVFFWAESGLMGKGKANKQPSTELRQTGQYGSSLSRRNQY